MNARELDGYLELWGRWQRVDLGRPRMAALRDSSAALGLSDFPEVVMMQLSGIINELGKPTTMFMRNYYALNWRLVDSARRAGFELDERGASRLLQRVKDALLVRLAEK